MDNLILAVNVVLPMFLLMMVGYFLTRIHLWDDYFLNIANRMCFKVALPVLLFNNIYSIDVSKVTNPKLLGFAVCAILAVVAVIFILVLPLTKDPGKRGALIQGAFRSNFVLFGLPVTERLFGPEGAAVASTLIAVVVPMFNVLAAIVLSVFSTGEKKASVKGILLSIAKNPLIIAAVLAFLFKALPFTLPTPVMTTVSDIGKLATPLALLTLGGQFHFDVLGSQAKYLAFGAVLRLIIVPCIILGAAIALGFRDMELGALLTMSASPCAVSSFTMAKEMHSDGELAGSLVVFTSFFSVFTMFLFIYILKTLALF